MSTQSQAPESPLASPATAPAAVLPSRTLYWSVRRELWENRSIYIAPLAVAGVVLFGYSVSMIHLPSRTQAALLLDPVRQHEAIDMPYTFAAIALMMTAFIVGASYCLGALHGERRDRSILFWKSLPVSDLTTVLAKASIPLAVVPLVTFVIVIATQLIMLLMSSAVLLASDMDATTLWTQVKFLQSFVAQLYAFAVMALWYAPIYGWLMLVSVWARRAVFLWAVLPVPVVGVAEKIAFNTSYTGWLLKERFIGWFEQAFVTHLSHAAIDPLTQLDPMKFLRSPGLWLGLIFAAGFCAAAARLRRYRQPI
jgi:ABC-2 type transport system permease protein